jgi:hypothetical protein
MKNRRSHFIAQAVCCLAATVFVAAADPQGPAGGPPSGPPPPGKRSPREPDRERELREKTLRSAEMVVALEKRDEKRIEAAIKQVKEDFKRIQIVRNEMVRNLLADNPLDYKLIADETEEINERAARLRIFLMPPTGDDKARKNQVSYDQDQMKGALILLCNRIADFIDNPVLRNPGTVDVEQSTKAGGDLLNIIELSGNIKRSAEKLSSRMSR